MLASRLPACRLDQGKEAGADRPVRPRGRRHRLGRGSDRPAHRAHQPPDRAPPHAQQGPPLAPRAADDGRQAPAAAPVPRARRPRPVPQGRLGPRPAPVMLARSRRRRVWQVRFSDRAPARGARLLAAGPQGRAGLALGLSRAAGHARVLPERLQPGLLGPALDLPGGQAEPRRGGPRGGRHQHRPLLGAPGLPQGAEPATSRCSPTSTRRARSPSAMAPTSRLRDQQPVARADRSREGVVELGPRVADAARDPGANLLFDALEATDKA